MSAPSTFAGGLMTIQNPDPIGLAVLVSAIAILFVAVWLMDKYDNGKQEEEPAKRCQVCGGRIVVLLGEWHHDGDAHLVVRAIPHVPEPLTARDVVTIPLICSGCGWTIGVNRDGVLITRDHECVGRWVS